MTSIQELPQKEQDALRVRLKKIEGQARGIQKMLDDGRDCVAVIEQMASMRSAVASLNGEMLEVFALHCLRNPECSPDPNASVEKMVHILVRNTR